MSNTMSPSIAARMIQNFTGESNLEYHWGYANRVIPCKNDAGSCAYLDVVYYSHDMGMLYSGVLWATIAAILIIWGGARAWRRVFPSRRQHGDLHATKSVVETGQPTPRPPFLSRLHNTLTTTSRRHLLPNSARSLFGHTTRLQILILFCLVAYLTLFSFLSITYSTWITPVKSKPGIYNTRTSLGPWADRVGIFAYALTPLSILLAQRESVLSWITGVPYTSFLFLHRWTGWIILLQSVLHTLGWVVVEVRLYQPQPAVWNELMAHEWMVWGFVALVLLVLIWFFSLSWTVRRVTGYEVFRKVHYVLAMVYIGALIGHWQQLQCFLIPGLVLWALDRAVRVVRMGWMHDSPVANRWGFGFAPAVVEACVWRDERHGDVVRLDFAHPREGKEPWRVGQHFYLCFTEGSIWQSHPFTPLALPLPDPRTGVVKHSYIFRAKKGETRKVADLLVKKAAAAAALIPEEKEDGAKPVVTTPIILQGPYGAPITDGLESHTNVLCVAGGTGITYVLPVLLGLAREAGHADRRIELIWAVKRSLDVEWVRAEMDVLRTAAAGIEVRVCVTDDETVATMRSGEKLLEEDSATSSQGFTSSPSHAMGRPNLLALVPGFVDSVTRGPTRVFGSGPPGMIGDLRRAVAGCNDGGKVWRGDERCDVELVCDDRMEW
jgi:predicted ferric reductase